MVSQVIEYGERISSAPRLTPSKRNWTPETPTLSVAVAETVTVPETVEPEIGAVIETVGGVVSVIVKPVRTKWVFPGAVKLNI